MELLRGASTWKVNRNSPPSDSYATKVCLIDPKRLTHPLPLLPLGSVFSVTAGSQGSSRHPGLQDCQGADLQDCGTMHRSPSGLRCPPRSQELWILPLQIWKGPQSYLHVLCSPHQESPTVNTEWEKVGSGRGLWELPQETLVPPGPGFLQSWASKFNLKARILVKMPLVLLSGWGEGTKLKWSREDSFWFWSTW